MDVIVRNIIFLNFLLLQKIIKLHAPQNRLDCLTMSTRLTSKEKRKFVVPSYLLNSILCRGCSPPALSKINNIICLQS